MRIDEALAQLRAAADTLAAEYPDLAADERAWIDTLDGMTDGLDLAEWLAERCLHLGALEDAAAERAKAMQARARRFGAEQDRLRSVIAALIEAAGGKKVVRATMTLSLTTPRPKLIEVDAAQTPPDMLRQPPQEPDKAAIREALHLGAIVPGWLLGNSPRNVTIRTR